MKRRPALEPREIPAVSQSPRQVRCGAGPRQSGQAALFSAYARNASVSAFTATLVVPLRFCLRASIAAGADSTATTRSKLACKPPRKQPDAGKKIPGQRALVARSYPVDKRIHQPAIHLEECAVIHAIIETRRAIGERSSAPLVQLYAAAVPCVPSTTISAPLSAGIRSRIAPAIFSKPPFAGLAIETLASTSLSSALQKSAISVGRNAGAIGRINSANAIAASSSSGAAMGHSLIGTTAWERRPR